MASARVSAAESNVKKTTVGGIEWTYTVVDETKKTCEVGGVELDEHGEETGIAAINESTTGKITIPSSLDGYAVVGICYAAFRGIPISAVTVPAGVVTIGEKAFMQCESLTSVTLPEGVTFIGEEAFSESAISNITLPQSLVRIGEQAFEGTRLTTITLPKNVKYLGNEDRVSDSGLLIEEDDLYGDVFNGCELLTAVIVAEGNTAYASVDGMLLTKDKKTLLFCPIACQATAVPQGVERIYEEAFYESHLTTITLPASLTEIGRRAFYGCDNLNEVVSYIEEPFEISGGTFGYETSATLYVPAGCKPKYEATPGWDLFTNIVETSSPSGIAVDATNFPDENFRNWVLAQNFGQDGVLTEEEIAEVKEIEVFNKDIADLKGIEYFTALTELDCYKNQLTALDMSQNTALEELFCDFNQLTSLDVSKNTALTRLYCDGNQLTSLDVSKNTALENLHCHSNQLASLDVSKNTALTYLSCEDNKLSSLDVSKNSALTRLYCDGNQLTELDVSKNTALTVLCCNGNQLTSLDMSENTLLKRLICDYNSLTSLNVTKCTALVNLDCESNQLTALDITKNTALTDLVCGENLLTSLDVSKNINLKDFDCSNNQITALNVSNNKVLSDFVCYKNMINGTAMDALIKSLPTINSDFVAISPFDSDEQNVITKTQVAAAQLKGWKTWYIDENGKWQKYEGSDPEIAPVDQGETINIGTEIDENTNLDGNVVGDIYYCISSDSGSYDPEEGCLVVTKPTDDSAIDGKDIFGEDFKAGFDGLVFMVAPGKGTIKVEAQTIGNMVLKVKVGDNAPTQMEVNGKTKVSFSYDVSEPTRVFIYGSSKSAGAKGMRKASSTDMLKIYGIEVTSETNGIEDIKDERLKMKDSSLYNLNGQRVISSPSGRPGGIPTKGIYIQNGKKVLVK
ncbi:MAG: leucine-rich repeat protein [Prevotella sp.]|nr:leucine-rich repeat protein [Prevotella sp.]